MIQLRLLIIIVVLIAFQSCDYFSPLKESKRKQKALQSKIDSLKNEHEKLETELKEIDHVLGMIEYSDSVFLKNDSSKINAPK